MIRRAGLGCVAALLVVGATGCGGGGDPDRYTLDETQSCLRDAGYKAVALGNDYLPGTDGNLRVQLASDAPKPLAPGAVPGIPARGYVFLVFDADPDTARRTQAKAVSMAVRSLKAQSILITPAAVRRGTGLSKNVFFYSTTGELTEAERERVVSCLR